MSFRLPSVIVYQELLSTTVSTTTPFMELCIVGPVYQVATDVKCDAYRVEEKADTDAVYSSAYIDQEIGSIIDTSSVSVKLTDAFVKIWPATPEVLFDDVTWVESDITSADYTPATQLKGSINHPFSEAHIEAGDYVEVTYKIPETDGTYQNITTKHAIKSVSDDGTILTLTKNLEKEDVEGVEDGTVVEIRVVRPTLEDIDISEESFLEVTNEGITFNFDGATPPCVKTSVVETAATVSSANVAITYRALRQDSTLINDFTTVTSYSNAIAKFGSVNINNPMSVAASIINAAIGDLSYKVLGVASDDYNGYAKAIDILANNHTVYCLVPLTDNKDVVSMFASHCKTMSQPLKSKWRICYCTMPMPITKTIVEFNDGKLSRGIPYSVGGKSYQTLFITDAANGVFQTKNCGTGDFIDIYASKAMTIDGIEYNKNDRIYSLKMVKVFNDSVASVFTTKYKATDEGYETILTTDAEGSVVDDEIVIEKTGMTEDELRTELGLDSSATLPTTTALKDGLQYQVVTTNTTTDAGAVTTYSLNLQKTEVPYEVVRTLDTQGVADYIGEIAESFKNKRLRYVMPDTIMLTVNNVTELVSGYYLCVALGAMRAGLPPHQGFSTMSISGITRVLNANKLFTEDQLAEMAGKGVFWVVQDEPEQLPYVIYQTTTDNTQLETAEDSIVATIDYASIYYRDNLKNVLGRYNVNTISVNYVKTVINACSNDMTTTSYEYIGPILTSAVLTGVTTKGDKIYPTIKIEVPYPVNGVDITLQV